jgi:ribosomal protein S18 acetylase RimI-like enzyme
MDYTIRPAALADIADIARVARETWRTTYAHSVAPHNQHQLLDRSYAPDSLAAAITADATWFYVAQHTTGVVGFAQFVRRADGHGELARLYVLPAHQRHGIGRALLIAGAMAMEQVGILLCYVSVEMDNIAAIAFYRCFGFRRHRTRASFLGDQIVRLIELKAAPHAICEAAQAVREEQAGQRPTQ